MAKQTRTTLKGYFETGDIPTGGNYVDLIDSPLMLNTENTGSANILGTITASGDISSSGDIIGVTGSFSDGRFTGNVGIGTTAPSDALHIKAPANGKGLYIEDHDSTNSAVRLGVTGNSGGRLRLYNNGTNTTGIELNGEGDSFINSGNVGIGNNNPSEKLTVEGNISSSGKIYGRQFEQIETNCAINFNGGHFAYLPLSNQNTNDSELSTNLNINRVAVVPGKPVKSIIRATGNSLGDNTPYTMSYWEAKETEPTTPIFKAAVYADTDSSSNKDAIRFDWSSPNSGSTIDIEEGSRIFMSLSSSNSGNTGYIITHLWEWDYNS